MTANFQKTSRFVPIALTLFTVLVFAVMAWLSLARYWGYNARMFDIGNMSQAIWSATQGEPLLFTTQGIPVSRLSRHVEWIYFPIALLYHWIPRPETLLILQTLLYSVGVWPVYQLAQRRLQSPSAAAICSLIYLLFPVMQTAVLYDFHGDTLAVPFLLLALEALDRNATKSYAIWLLIALSCKFYVAVPVLTLGVVLMWQKRHRIGVATATLGLVWGLVMFFMVRPAFAPHLAEQVQATSASYFSYYFGQVDAILNSLGLRFLVAIIIYMPILWLGWRAPLWLLISSSIALPTLISTGPGPSYDYRYHHYALAVPFLIAALIYGAEQAKRLRPQRFPLHLGGTLILAFLISAIFVDTPLNPNFYTAPPGSGRGLSDTGYGITARDNFKTQWLATHIPPQAPLAADIILAPHLTQRHIVYITRSIENTAARIFPEFLAEVDYVVVDALFDFRLGQDSEITLGGPLYEQESIRYLLQDENFGLIRADDGLLLFQKGEAGLSQKIVTETLVTEAITQANFAQAIGLLSAQISRPAPNLIQLDYRWLALDGLSAQPPLIAISQIGNTPHSRLVHLPSQILFPTTHWQPGQIMRETLTLRLPPHLPPGEHNITVTWHNSSHIFAPETDVRSQLGPAKIVGTITILP